MEMSGQHVNFHFLKTLFDIEYPMSESLRAACRLKRYHIYPINFQKMTVSTAVQVNVIFNSLIYVNLSIKSLLCK